MGSGCSLGTDILEKVCTPEDIDNKIKNYFQNNKCKRKKRRNTRFFIDNYSDDENINYEENEENENYNDYDEENEDYNEEYNENNILNDKYENIYNNSRFNNLNKYNNSRYNNLRYKNKYVTRYLNPLSSKHIDNRDFNLEPLSLDIVSNYKKINRRLNNKNCELRLTKLLLQGKEDECENLKKSINCIATNSLKY